MASGPCTHFAGSRLATLVATCLVSAGPAAAAGPSSADGPAQTSLFGVYRLEGGLVLPYPLDNLFRGYIECTGRGQHKALDIGGVGPDGGLGSSVRAMAKAKVLQIGMPADDPERFGKPLIGEDTVMRSTVRLPAWKNVPGYGKVHFFTRDYGRHRSGGVITLRLLDGPLEGHEVHYLHLAAARPELKVGDVVEAGEELGLLGGTAVLDSPPHLHLTVETRQGTPLDVGRLFGIGATRVPCRAGGDLTQAIRGRYTKAAKILMSALRADRERNISAPEPIASCGPHVSDGDFANGKHTSHRVTVSAAEDQPLAPITVRLERVAGKGWAPRIQLEDQHGNPLFTGTLTTAKAKRRFAFESKASGRRGDATVVVTPKKPEDLVVRVMAWPTHKRAYKGATWRLTVDRACE